jgi:hypothetical protein
MDDKRKTRESVIHDVTFDSRGGTNFSGGPGHIEEDTKPEIISALNDYMREADENRKSGLNPRDDKWRQNLDLYWNRWDYSNKMEWQAQESMPEVPGFVDRFSAALKEALIQTPEGFYAVTDPSDVENDMAQAIKRVTDVWLSTAGRNQVGQTMHYSAVFEDQMKLGALMASASVTTWKDDYPGGRVSVESVDPRMVWLDHTGRNLYRIRRIEVDRHELSGMKTMLDAAGEPIFDDDQLSKLESALYDKAIADQERTGTAQNIVSGRRPIQLDEYIATVVGNDGRVLADRSLMVLANNQYLVRGPEKNPFWHGKDWLTYTPLISAPLSVYGRSYMEDFGSVAKTFNELTNMIIDAVHTSSLKAWAIVPEMLLNPNQIAEGITPNKVFLLEDGYDPAKFAKELELGNLSADSVKVWQAMKTELTEAAKMNEVGLGQFAPKGRTSATEISETQQSSSALIRSVAQTVETRLLDPQLDLIWKTGMQHADPESKMLKQAAGEEMWAAMMANRKEFVMRPVTFQARGISQVIARAQQMKTLMQVLSIIAQNEAMAAAFFQRIDMTKLIDLLFRLSGIDLTKLTVSERERAMQQLGQPIQQAANQAQEAAGGTQPSPQGQQMIDGAAQSLGIGK